MADRPDWHKSWPEVPEGCEVVAVVDPDWRVLTTADGYYCSRGGRHAYCANRAAAALNRRSRRGGKIFDAWWRYCPEHMYGRWVEDGKVMHWILRKTAGP